MNISKERKFFTIVLIFYWVGIFFATHIPVPDWTRKMGVSDKIMHFAAYFVLMLLLWLSANFEQKADWKKIRAWLLMGIVAGYAIFDEGSQYFMKGRSADLYDLLTNFLGFGAAMSLVTILTGRHTAMIPFAVFPLFLPGLVRSKLIPQGTIVEVAVYGMVLAVITIAWIRYISSVHKLDVKRVGHIPIFLGGPVAILAVVKIYAVFTSKAMEKAAILSAIAAIIITVFIWYLAAKQRSAT